MHTVTMHTEKYDHNMKDKQGEIFSEAIYDSGSSKHSDLNSCVTNGSGSSIDSERQVNIMTGDESGKNNYSDTRINGSKSVSVSTRRSSSSSSSESSLDGFFVMDTLNFTTSSASTSKSRKDYVSSSHSSSKSEDDNSVLVPTSTFQVSNVTHSQKGFPPTSSPSIQVMDRSGGYDPARIPSAVFHRNSNPLEWSSASNESLFSLQIENNSFSREHMFGEVSMSPELTKSGEMNLFSRTSSILTEEVDTARKSADVENPQTNKTSDNAFKLEERLSEDQNEKRSIHGHCATILIVAGRSVIHVQPAAIHGQAVSVLIVGGRSATVGTLAIQKAVVMPPPMSFGSLYLRERSDEGASTDGWEEEDTAEPKIGDGGDGGGVALQNVPWGQRAHSIAEEVLTQFTEDIELYAFKTTPRGYVYVRLDKITNEYGCPSMEELERYNQEYRKRLDEVGALGEVPDDLGIEVSSPGAERILKVPDDLSRFKDMPMRVCYTENVESNCPEEDGIFLLDSIDRDSEICIWKLADVKENRDPLKKGKPLNRKQKDWRLKLPFNMHRMVTLYLD
ncbi:hypothetical protein TanjilG_02412 [Lupinus angustifolius]|uniref:DUF7912 domain-containing protein n=1 Tax=Lupinus angustifolius TaxID=3871 RepID=A0A1J7GP38_LUPAN|nr:hypothetical protein TanjilG_02412 [Lupinus angustifolius]